MSELTSARGQPGFLWPYRMCMLGCMLLATTISGGTSEEVRRFDNDRDGRTGHWECYRDGVLLRGEVDRHQDGHADEAIFYEQKKPVRAEFDTYSDGTVDHMVHYETPGRVAREWENLEATGKPRTRLIYESGALVRGEFDSTGNGQVNQWLFFDVDGHVICAEYDQHARGRPDQWEYFTPGSKEPFKVERDTDGDGKADAEWEKGASAAKRRR